MDEDRERLVAAEADAYRQWEETGRQLGEADCKLVEARRQFAESERLRAEAYRQWVEADRQLREYKQRHGRGRGE
jgi:hypothetical protein